MNPNMLVSLINNRTKLGTTAEGHKVVENHIAATRRLFDNARGPERDQLRHQLNAMIYAYNKVRGY